MTDPLEGLVMRRFRNDTGSVIVALGHSFPPAQDVQILMPADVESPAGLTETTDTAPSGPVEEPAPEAEAPSAPEQDAAPVQASLDDPPPPPVEEVPAEVAPVEGEPEPPAVA